MEIKNPQQSQIPKLGWDGPNMSIVPEDQRMECGAQLAQECRYWLGIESETLVEKQGPDMGQPGECRGDVGAGLIACGEGGVVGKSPEGERDNVVDLVLVGHALDAMPPAPADVGNGGGPCIACGLHDLIHSFLFMFIRASSIMSHRESGLWRVDECRGDAGV